jgi:hypothetical protein
LRSERGCQRRELPRRQSGGKRRELLGRQRCQLVAREGFGQHRELLRRQRRQLPRQLQRRDSGDLLRIEERDLLRIESRELRCSLGSSAERNEQPDHGHGHQRYARHTSSPSNRQARPLRGLAASC